MDLKELPTKALRIGLDGARKPLHYAQTSLHKSEQWTPTVLFDTFEVTLKDTAGKLLKDPTLTKEAAALRKRLLESRKEAAAADLATEREKSKAAAVKLKEIEEHTIQELKATGARNRALAVEKQMTEEQR